MAHFIRFIFFIVIAGIVVSVALVTFSDVRSRRRQVRAESEERKLFEQLIDRYNGHLRSGHIAVEWQKVSATGEVMETSILIRRYLIDADGKQVPLPIKRLILPGGRVCVDGLSLEFDALFNEDFKAMRSVRLAYFDHVFCESQPLADRLAFLQEGQVPDATLVHLDHVTHAEEKLWQYLWPLIPTTDRSDRTRPMDPRESQQMLDRAAKQGLTIRWKPPACSVVKNGMVYAIFVGVGDEGVHIDRSDDPSLLHDMLNEIQEQDAERSPPVSAPTPVQR